MKKPNIVDLSVELDGICGILEIFAVYVQSAYADNQGCDVIDENIVVDAIRGIASHCERISHDLAHMEGTRKNG